jgi:hypothetical protein
VVADLLFFFLVSQTLPGLPAMQPGTEVRVVSQDLLTIFASARVDAGSLTFDAPLTPGLEIRLLIFPPDATDQERAAALSGAQALVGWATPDGDLLVQFPEVGGPISLRKWLEEERGLDLVLPAP